MDLQSADDIVMAEAAAWIARLQGAGRTEAAEAAFREWLAADPSHARAFARATDVWEILPGAARLNGVSRPPGIARQPVIHVARRRLAFVCAAALVAVIFFGAFWFRQPTLTTAIGQQQSQTLSDGTRISLNTNSRITVAFSRSERRVRIERGEGLFEVAKDAARPFVVEAGNQRVTALGTTFLVRRDGGTVAVTLIEGHIAVTRVTPSPASQTPQLLQPGERLTLRSGAAPDIDHPRVEAVTAWRHGEVIFDDVSLPDAVAEINRYSESHVVVLDPALASLRVSGVFETRDPAEFASAIARLHRLEMKREGTHIALSR